jgi:hypothetical protein
MTELVGTRTFPDRGCEPMVGFVARLGSENQSGTLYLLRKKSGTLRLPPSQNLTRNRTSRVFPRLNDQWIDLVQCFLTRRSFFFSFCPACICCTGWCRRAGEMALSWWPASYFTPGRNQFSFFGPLVRPFWIGFSERSSPAGKNREFARPR